MTHGGNLGWLRTGAAVACLTALAGCGPTVIGAGLSDLFGKDTSTPVEDQHPTVAFIRRPPDLSRERDVEIRIEFSELIREDELQVAVERLEGGFTRVFTGVNPSLDPGDPPNRDGKADPVLGNNRAYTYQGMGLDDGTYKFSVVNARDLSVDGNAVTGETSFSWVLDIAPPPTPGDRQVIDISRRTAEVSWSAVADPGNDRPVKYLVRARIQNPDAGVEGLVEGTPSDGKLSASVGSLSLKPGFYAGLALLFKSGEFQGESRRIESYTIEGGKPTFVFATAFSLPTRPDGSRPTIKATDQFEILIQDTVDMTVHTLGLEPLRLYEIEILAEDELGNRSEPGKFPLVRTEAGSIGEFSALGVKLPVGVMLASPIGLASDDFNGDRHPDLAVLEGVVPGKILVLLGKATAADGEIAFADSDNEVDLTGAPPIRPVALRHGDVNGDGVTDLVVASMTEADDTTNLEVLLGNGDGTFAPVQRTNVSSHERVTSLALLDFDRDGNLDAAVAGEGTAAVAVLPGNGNGTFDAANAVWLDLASGGPASSIAAADVNNDTVPDLVASSGASPELSIFPGNGVERTPGEPRTYFDDVVAVPVFSQPESLAAADFDADRIADLAVLAPNEGQYAGAMRVLLGVDGVLRKAGTVVRTTGTVTPDEFSVDNTRTVGKVAPSAIEETDVAAALATVDTSRREGFVSVTRREGAVDVRDFDEGAVAAPSAGAVLLDSGEVDSVAGDDDFAAGGSALSNVDDFYNGMDLRFLTGNNAGDSLPILDYTGATHRFVFGKEFDGAVATGNLFDIVSKSRIDSTGATLSDEDDFYNGATLEFSPTNKQEILDYEVDLGRKIFRFAANFAAFPADGAPFVVHAKDSFRGDGVDGTLDVEESDPDFVKGRFLRFTSGAIDGESRKIVSYDPVTKSFKLANALSQFPEEGQSFEIVSPSDFNGTKSSTLDMTATTLYVRFTSGALTSQVREVATFTGTSTEGVFAFAQPFGAPPEDGDEYVIEARDRFDGGGFAIAAPDFVADPSLRVRFLTGSLAGQARGLSGTGFETVTGEFTLAGPTLSTAPKQGDTFVIESAQEFDAGFGLLDADGLFNGRMVDVGGAPAVISTYTGATRTIRLTAPLGTPPAEGAEIEILPLGNRFEASFFDETLAETDGAYNGNFLRFTTGALAGDSPIQVTAYDAETRSFTLLSAFSPAPEPTDKFEIIDPAKLRGDPPLVQLDDFYTGRALVFAGQMPAITAYDGLTREFTLSPPLNPIAATGDTFTIAAGPQSFDGDASLSDEDDAFNGMTLKFISGALATQSRVVEDYYGATGTFVLGSPFGSAPAGGDDFVLLSKDRIKGNPGLPDENGYFTGEMLLMTSGALNGQSVLVRDYDGPTRTFFTDPFASPPDRGDTFRLENQDAFDADGSLSSESGFYTGGSVRFLTGPPDNRKKDVLRNVIDYAGPRHRFFFGTPWPEMPMQGDQFLVEVGNGGDDKGDMEYAHTSTYPTGKEPRAILAEDLDGDHVLDIAATSTRAFGAAGTGDVDVWFGVGSDGYGTGGFAPSVSALARRVVGVTQSLTVFVGDRTLPDADVLTGRMLRFISPSSLDGQVQPIVAYNADTREITVGAPFTDPTTHEDVAPSIGDEFIIEFGTDPRALAAADFDGDGIRDLAVAFGDDNRVAILLGVGRNGASDGGHFDNNALDVPFATPPEDLFASDLDANGDADLAVLLNPAMPGDPAAVAVLRGDEPETGGRGRFAPPNFFTLQQYFRGGPGAAIEPIESSEAKSLAAADFSDDGVLDLIVVGRATLAGPTPIDFLTILEGQTQDRRPTGEYRLDVLQQAANDGSGGVLTGEFGRRYVPPVPAPPSPPNERPTEPATDVVMAGVRTSGDPNLGGLFHVFGDAATHGVLTLPAMVDANPGRLDAADCAAVASGDLNGDGKLDVVAALQGTNTLKVFLGKLDAEREPNKIAFVEPALEFNVGASPSALALADFDGDGSLDLAVADRDQDRVRILKGLGNGTFGATLAEVTVGAMPVFVAVADVNRDGVLDFATANKGVPPATPADVSVLIGAIEAGNVLSFDTRDNYTADDPVAVAFADFNRDGVLDLAVANRGSSNVQVRFGRETKTNPGN